MPARPQHPPTPLPLLPSGPDGVHGADSVGGPAQTANPHYCRVVQPCQATAAGIVYTFLLLSAVVGYL